MLSVGCRVCDVEGFHASSEQNLRSDKENNLQQKQVMKSSDAIDSKTIFQMTLK